MSELFHSLIIIGSIIPQYYGRRNGECSDNIQKKVQRSADGPFFFSGHGGGLDGKTVLAMEAMERPKRPRYTPAKDGFGI
jgi:hypothetical protein